MKKEDKNFIAFNRFKSGDLSEQDNIKELTDIDDAPIAPEKVISDEEIKIQKPLPVNKGITPKKLPVEVLSILNERLIDEYTAHFFYRNAANWCKNVNYKNATLFFEKEAEAELEHAKRIQSYIIKWNGIPTIPQVPTSYNFQNLVDIINKAYQIECELLEKYSENQKTVFQLHPATFNFIQKYVDIQNEEVEEYSDFLNALLLINPENKFELLYFENEYFEED